MITNRAEAKRPAPGRSAAKTFSPHRQLLSWQVSRLACERNGPTFDLQLRHGSCGRGHPLSKVNCFGLSQHQIIVDIAGIMIVQPNARDFGLSQETLARVERLLEKDMPLRVAGGCLAGAVVTLILIAGIEDTGWRVLSCVACAVFGFRVLQFVYQKTVRLALNLAVSSNDWANHARYRWAMLSYRDTAAAAEREWRDQQMRKMQVEQERQRRELRVKQERQRQESEAKRRRLNWWQSLDGHECDGISEVSGGPRLLSEANWRGCATWKWRPA
jgi:hypothetical protein